MSETLSVFHNVETPLDTLIEQATQSPCVLANDCVTVLDAARAVEGEVWSPQLSPYEAWKASGVSSDAKGGTVGDLYTVGALGMGISDEELEHLLAQAHKQPDEGDSNISATSQSIQAQLDSNSFTDEMLRNAIGVRRDEDGYVLASFDLRQLATQLGKNDGLIVVLPSSIGGVPLVRIATEAFARRLVQGVGVRLLVIPNEVKRVGADSFLALSAQRIHVGSGVQQLGEQHCDLAGVSPRLARREYSVSALNKNYMACDGNLFSKDKKDLLFLASPYGQHIELPKGVEHITSAAFAQGCEVPSVVDCDEALARVDDHSWDDAVWRCADRAPVVQSLKKRGVRLAGSQAVELDGCWYDFNDEGAVLIAGPPKPLSVSQSFADKAAIRAVAVRKRDAHDGNGALDDISPAEAAAEAANEFAASGEAGSTVNYVSARVGEMLALPAQVAGRPLVRIGVRALPWAPASVVVPDTVRAIERDNACRSTKRLVLCEGLETIGEHCFCSRKLEPPVSIPASVRSIGEGSFEYAICRLEHTGSIVHISADQLLSCFLVDPLDDIPFDFERYDELLRLEKNVPDRLGAILHRLAKPVRLDETLRNTFVEQLRAHEQETLERVAQEGDRSMVEALIEAGFINDNTFDRQIELLRVRNRTDCVLYLMEWRRAQREAATQESTAGASFSLHDRFAL